MTDGGGSRLHRAIQQGERIWSQSSYVRVLSARRSTAPRLQRACGRAPERRRVGGERGRPRISGGSD